MRVEKPEQVDMTADPELLEHRTLVTLGRAPLHARRACYWPGLALS